MCNKIFSPTTEKKQEKNEIYVIKMNRYGT